MRAALGLLITLYAVHALQDGNQAHHQGGIALAARTASRNYALESSDNALVEHIFRPCPAPS